ncbi:LacI family DNA-binding transcriptional regulator [Rhizobium binae]|uniref:LacI family transcriptional regulator n=1 Tax=Rhizobium binae TaxID=1138190 RepID=A0ABV2MB26_9HYPH|nr:substrate-binding domain-containing protein [Rhizobium binae]NKL48359.1 LacI family DNA-binding transcriptional regulator [Rhizobium leguminosarum bv. viciae]MBX4929939.1 substrate-binding domain-containing protein [Rhizobium binae]MBX4939743.1 substrate-binding domain-containing protein [Rhizobium binae]MBX4946262.1 substrate-binding domain-containing protein [Rhizobium binae]MBX4953765.1 substrate-binding domain-containing protein [Rhizobium binae]
MNLKQLSELLGLSQTTVSRALNGYPEVNEATRERVLQAVKETGYRPNKAAQRLATGKAGSIGLVMPTAPGHQSDVHFGEFLAGLGEEAVRHDFHFVIMPSDPDDEVAALRRLAISGNVDALFVAYMRGHDPRLPMLKSLSMPYVVHGRSFGAEPDYPYLDIDNEGAFYDATRLLLQLGHTRFALMNGQVHLDFAIRRKNGVVTALAERGLALEEDCVIHALMTDEQGLVAMERFLQLPQRPTAILCSSTVMALGAIRAVNQAGLRLGEDISLIAHDDVLPLLKPENFSVPLTTTRSSLRAAGVRIAQRLIGTVKQAGPFPEQELWKTELIVRASTGPAPS